MYQLQWWLSYSLFIKEARGLKEWLYIVDIYSTGSVWGPNIAAYPVTHLKVHLVIDCHYETKSIVTISIFEFLMGTLLVTG